MRESISIHTIPETPRHSRTFHRFQCLVFCVVLSIVASPLFGQQVLDSTQEVETVVARADELSAVFRKVAKDLKPSVVSIKSLQMATLRSRGGFEEELFGFGGGSEEGVPIDQGIGSGVVVSTDGFILTNNHVVRGADKLQVQLSDDSTYDAQIVGTDPRSDLAVLKIEAQGLSAARLGESDRMEVGDWVIAIGSPFGLNQTVTTGIVSATNREDVEGGSYANFLQTDAAVNPGNSGGPLLNLRGEVIGINTAIATRTGAYSGISFAIPSNLARRVLESILSSGRMVRGYIGIQMMTEQDQREIGFRGKGVVVGGVSSNGPAEKAGMQAEDVIQSINGKPVDSLRDVRLAVGNLPVGSEATIGILRNNQPMNMRILIEEQTGSKLLGIEVQGLDRENAKRLGLRSSAVGVLVSRIDRSSPFSNDISVGDAILAVNNVAIQSEEDLNRMIDNATGGLIFQIKTEDDMRRVLLR